MIGQARKTRLPSDTAFVQELKQSFTDSEASFTAGSSKHKPAHYFVGIHNRVCNPTSMVQSRSNIWKDIICDGNFM